MKPRRVHCLVPCLTLLMAGTAACGGSGDDVSTQTEPEFRGLALCIDVPSPTGSTGFIFAVDQLSEGVVSLEDGVETGGGGGSTCETAFGYAFVGAADSPVVTRYSRNDEGIMIPGPRVSFGNFVSTIFSGRGRAFRFLSEDRALYVDRTTGTVVVWNPTEMTVTDSVQLEGFEFEESSGQSIFPVLVGEQRDDVLMFVRYPDADGVQLKRTALISLNPETLEYTISVDERCGGFFNDVETSDGTIYMASHTFVAAQQLLGLSQDEPCMLRVLPGETEFDPDFYVELKDLTGGLAAGAILRGPGDGAIMLIYDSEVLADTVNTIVVTPTWRPVLIEDLNALDTVVEIPGASRTSGAVNQLFESQGRLYLPRIEGLGERAVLQDVTDPFDIRDGLTVSGGFFIGGGDLLR